MTSVNKFIPLLVLLVSASSTFAEVARPSNLLVEKPGADVPQECSQFFSETGWVGKWDNMRAHELWIEKIGADCTAQAVYSYGARPGTADLPSYVRVTDAKVENGVLKLKWPRNGATISITYTIDGNSLVGKWESNRSFDVSQGTLNRR